MKLYLIEKNLLIYKCGVLLVDILLDEGFITTTMDVLPGYLGSKVDDHFVSSKQIIGLAALCFRHLSKKGTELSTDHHLLMS